MGPKLSRSRELGLFFRGDVEVIGFKGSGFRAIWSLIGFQNFPKLVVFFGAPIIRIHVVLNPLLVSPHLGKPR